MRPHDEFGHDSVQVEEVFALLKPRSGGVWIDGTVGAGGHLVQLAERIGDTGRILGFDRDAAVLPLAARRVERFGERIELIAADFGRAPEYVRARGINGVQGILLDLGVSSMQLDTPERGFSFREDGPLDMRMSQSSGLSAADLIRTLPVTDLEQILREYGEEPQARAIARKIVEVRKRTQITRTKELSELVRSVVSGGGKTHPATRTFQALRIAVNQELDILRAALPQLCELLVPGGRLVVLSFHSLEDRIVKLGFREMAALGVGESVGDGPAFTGEKERKHNPRSRSAKARAFERR